MTSMPNCVLQRNAGCGPKNCVAIFEPTPGSLSRYAPSASAEHCVKLMKAGKKAGRKRQKRRVGLGAFGRVPENFMARELGCRTKGKSRASRFLACYEN